MEPGHPSKAPATPIALVFTDMVGSSAAKRAASLGGDSDARDAAFLNAIQVRHFKLVRECMHPHGGTEIMTMGDAFFLTFPDVRSAVLCAADIQRSLKAQPIMTAIGPMQLRIGVHCGTPKFTDNSWHGKDVDTAGRVEAAACGGQIILSEPARRLMAATPEVKLHSLGTFSLAGIEVPLWDIDYAGEGARTPQILSIEQTRRRGQRKLLRNGGAVVLVALLALASTLWFRHRQQNRLRSGDKLLLSSFKNETGDTQFDLALEQALAIQLDQSPFLRVAGPAEVRADLGLMHLAQVQPVTPKAACGLGPQSGIKAFVAGSISGRPSNYTVTLRAFNCLTGASIAHAKEQAADKNHVLAALTRATSSLRVSLGESSDSVIRFANPFATETTSGLDALHLFAQAEQTDRPGGQAQDIAVYRQAIALDPGFALAYARIGVIELRAGRTPAALKDLSRAYELRDHATEHQRLGILALLAQARGNLPSAIAGYQQLLRTFPLDGDALEYLGDLYTQAGDPIRAAPFFERATAAAPWKTSAMDKLAATRLVLGDPAGARPSIETSAAMPDHDDAFGKRNRIVFAFESGDPNWKSLIATENTPSADIGVIDLLYLTGQLGAARATVEQSVASSISSGSLLTAGNLLASAALEEAVYGVCTQVPDMTARALAFDTSVYTLPAAVAAQILCGHESGGSSALSRLAQQFPENTLLNDIYLPETAAASALREHHPGEVQAALKTTRPYRLASRAPNLEAEAQLALHRPDEALSALAPALRYPFNGIRSGLAGERPAYGMTLLLGARAHAMAGDNVAAGQSLDRALDLWKHADPGFPPLLQAQRERAALNTRTPSP